MIMFSNQSYLRLAPRPRESSIASKRLFVLSEMDDSSIAQLQMLGSHNPRLECLLQVHSIYRDGYQICEPPLSPSVTLPRSSWSRVLAIARATRGESTVEASTICELLCYWRQGRSSRMDRGPLRSLN